MLPRFCPWEDFADCTTLEDTQFQIALDLFYYYLFFTLRGLSASMFRIQLPT